MRTVLAVMSLVLLVGCSGDPDGSPAPTDAPSSTPSSLERPLIELCAEAEGLVIAWEDDDAATAADLKADLEVLAADGDREAESAFEILIAAVAASDTSGLEEGDVEGVVDAQSAFREGLDSFAARCKAAGSSAFQ